MDSMRLTTIERASRYIGGEYGSVLKDPGACGVHLALAFPDLYEIGMSSMGFQLLYRIANDREDTYAERVFSPWTDFRDELTRSGAPLVSLETKTPLGNFGLVLFSIQYELAATNVITMLDLGHIPRRAKERGEDAPLVIAGGHCANNPEPWAPFFDALVIGEGEEVLGEILDVLAPMKGAPRSERLKAILDIPGLYNPDDFDPRYQDGRFAGFRVREGASPAIRRIVADLDAAPALTRPIVPNTRLVHDRYAVEIMRGCTRGCRFCQPGFVTRPLRERKVGTILDQIDKGLKSTGYDEVTLLSLSTGDYSRLSDLTRAVRLHGGKNISLSLPSIRAECVSDELMADIAATRKTGFTIAPEAGTERLRQVLNKPIRDEDILEACRRANRHGWNLVKFYFMIGLPTESPEDLEGIVELCQRALGLMSAGPRKGQINVNIGTFVPKPFTPFAWERQASPDESWEKIHFLKSRVRRSRIRIKAHDPGMSLIEGIITRGDRRLAEVMERVVDMGGGFDGWTEHFRLERWMQAFDECGYDWKRVLAGYSPDAPLPWDGVNVRVDKPFLLQERKLAWSRSLTEDCRHGACTDCGTCDAEVLNVLAQKGEFFDPPRKNAEGPKTPPIIYRYRVRYAKIGLMRHLGHLELASMMHRALRRAGFALAYSQGYHPQPRVSFGPPLSVGIESRDEYFDFHLVEYQDAAKLKENLSRETLEELPILEVRQIGLKEPALFLAIRGIEYQARLDALVREGFVNDEAVAASIERFRRASDWPVQVRRKGKLRTIQAQEVVARIEMQENHCLLLRLRHRASGGLKPTQVLSSILELPGDESKFIRYTKVKTFFEAL